MRRNQIIARLAEIRAGLEPLAAREDQFTDDESALWRSLSDEMDTLTAELGELDRRVEVARRLAAVPAAAEQGANVRRTAGLIDETADPYDLSDISIGAAPEEIARSLRDKAMRAVERARDLTGESQDRIDGLLRNDDDAHGTIARLLLATGSEAYRSAFAKAVTGRMHLLSADESQALARAHNIARSVAIGSDAAGGFLMPFTLDPTIISTQSVPVSSIRARATKRTTTTNSWNGVRSGGVTGRWAGEGTQADDNSPTFARAPIAVHRKDIFVEYSIEAEQDLAGLSTEVAFMIAEKGYEMEAVALTAGTGVGQPLGYQTAIAAVGGSVVNTADVAVFAMSDVYNLLETLPSRYRQNASWQAELGVINDMRQFGNASNNANFLTNAVGDTPQQLLGKPLDENSVMTSVVAAGNHILAIGDFSRYYVVDRIGTTVEYIPQVFGANGRPRGERGWFAYSRMGAAPVDANAFRLLRVRAA